MAKQNNVLPFTSPGEPKGTLAPQELSTLARLIEKFAPHEGHFDLPVPGLHVLRRSLPTSGLSQVMSVPGLCIVAQGAKRVCLSDKELRIQ